MYKPRYRLTTIGECKEGDTVHLIMSGKTKPITIIGRGPRTASYFYGFKHPSRLVAFVTMFPVQNHRKAWRKVS